MSKIKKIDEVVYKKLEEAFLKDLNISQACLYAGIGRQTYYDYINKKSHQKDKEYFELLRENVKLKAKFNVAEKIESGDIETSKWLLEHRASDEYGKKLNAEMNGDIKIELSENIEDLGK